MRLVRVRSSSHTAAVSRESVLEASTFSGTAVHRLGLMTTAASRGTSASQSQASMHAVTARRTSPYSTPRSATRLFPLSAKAVSLSRLASLLAPGQHEQVVVQDLIGERFALEGVAAGPHQGGQAEPGRVEDVLVGLHPTLLREGPGIVIHERALMGRAAPHPPVPAQGNLVKDTEQPARPRSK